MTLIEWLGDSSPSERARIEELRATLRHAIESPEREPKPRRGGGGGRGGKGFAKKNAKLDLMSKQTSNNSK
jgi:hypothetical protein